MVDEGDQKTEDENIELQKAEALRLGKGVKGFGGVISWGFEVISSGADEMVQSQRNQRGRRQHVIE